MQPSVDAAQNAAFQLEYEPLSGGSEGLGRVAVVPWDSGIFGFGIADYRPESAAGRPIASALRAALAEWASSRRVELISATVPAARTGDLLWLAEAGFVFVDCAVKATFLNLAGARLLPVRLPLRVAGPADWAGVEAIAASAFSAGRYHADGRVPRELADLRYRRWIQRALCGGGSERVYVTGPEGNPRGFFHLILEGDRADLRLAAIHPALHGGTLGFQLYAAVLQTLQALGIARAYARISPLNTPILNVYSALGFRFSDAETVFHWHAPLAPHLLSGCQGTRDGSPA